MAKQRPGLDDLFKKTAAPESGEVEVPAEGRTISVGVGLKESEVAMLDRIAGDLGVARNALMRYGLRYFLTAYLAGEVNMTEDVQERKSATLRMP